MIRIIQASENDFETIIGITHKTWPSTFGNILSPEQINYMLKLMYSRDSLFEQCTQKQHQFILAFDNSVCIGFVSYQYNYEGSAKTKIHKLYILPEAQGKGVGKILLNEIAGLSLQNQNNVLSLNVNRFNSALGFYGKAGFAIVREENIDIGNGFFMEDYVMEKFITLLP